MQGIIITSASNEVIAALGRGADERVGALVADPEWLAEAESRRFMPIDLDGESLVAFVTPVGEARCILLSEQPSETVLRFFSNVDFAYDIVEHILTDPYDAMVVVDSDAKLAFISPVHERFFGLESGEGIGRHVADIIEDTRLPKILETGEAEVGQILNLADGQRVVSRHPIRHRDEIVGAIGRVMFKGPAQVGELLQKVNTLEKELAIYKARSKDESRAESSLSAIIGQSVAIQSVREQIRKIAPLDIPVLIEGESGTGKELVARALHMLSPRHAGHLVSVNAAALPDTLVEAELFGYKAGSFTGADRKGRRGKFELADKGTIFFDEIGDMPIEVQLKLMRVLQDHVIEKVGSNQPQRVDFRLISATNRDLSTLIEQEKFRLDLYYRISPVRIFLPPLEERSEDIPLLLHHFIREMCQKYARPVPEIAIDVPEYLMSKPWPGNIRQLRHEVERAFVFAEDGQLGVEDFAQNPGSVDAGFTVRKAAVARPAPDLSATLPEAVEHLASELIADAMMRYKGNKKKVAETLGISRSYLYKKLKEEPRH